MAVAVAVLPLYDLRRRWRFQLHIGLGVRCLVPIPKQVVKALCAGGLDIGASCHGWCFYVMYVWTAGVPQAGSTAEVEV